MEKCEWEGTEGKSEMEGGGEKKRSKCEGACVGGARIGRANNYGVGGQGQEKRGTKRKGIGKLIKGMGGKIKGHATSKEKR